MNELQGDDEIPEMLSTHPANETRAQDLDKIMDLVIKKNFKYFLFKNFKIIYLKLKALKIRKECNCYELPERVKMIPNHNYSHQNHRSAALA
jgi:hypothetical protein